MRHLAFPVLALALAACVPQPAARPPSAETARAIQGTVAAGAQGGFETGKLTPSADTLRGPFVVTFLSDGAALELVRTSEDRAVLGTVTGPLLQPVHLSATVALRLAGAGEVTYGGYRPMPITRALEGYLGRSIWLGAPGAPPEQWVLREIGQDHVTVERSRTYRVLPVRRISEITWTDLTGIDPTPRVLLGPE